MAGYVGVKLRAEQVVANEGQAALGLDPKPRWINGDSREIGRLAKDVEADLIFSCPPYWNLEVYSDDPADLSTLGKEAFFAESAKIIAATVSRLKQDRFAVWVIGDVRDAQGFYANLPGRTVEAFEAAGARFYNNAILVTAVGSLPIRVGRQFTIARKLGRTHQNVLVFCKGDPKRATEACGQVEFGEIEGAGAEGDEAEATIHVHPKKFGETASVKPPFPSDPHYDAKASEMCMAKRGPGNVLFWNVAPLPRP